MHNVCDADACSTLHRCVEVAHIQNKDKFAVWCMFVIRVGLCLLPIRQSRRISYAQTTESKNIHIALGYVTETPVCHGVTFKHILDSHLQLILPIRICRLTEFSKTFLIFFSWDLLHISTIDDRGCWRFLTRLFHLNRVWNSIIYSIHRIS